MRERTPTSAEQRLTGLFTAHHAQVVAYVARRSRPLGDQALAQDVASEVFALVWRRLSGSPDEPGVDVPEPALPWLLVTARNLLSQRTRDDHRRTAREERVMTDRALAGTAPVVDGGILALGEQVARALDRMAPDDRELLLLRAWDELPFTAVAQVLGCSPGAARVRWMRARRRFAVALTAEDAAPAPPGARVMPRPLTTTGDAR